MNVEITESNGFAPMAKISLNRNEEVKIERGSMVYHTDEVTIEGNLKERGSLLKSIGKSMLSGESIFLTTAKSSKDDGVVAIAPSMYGSIEKLKNGETSWVLGDGAFLACDNTIDYTVTRQNKNLGASLFGGTGGFFNMICKGHGDLLISSYGAIQKVEITNDKPFHVDNGHALAWSSTLNYDLQIASGSFGFKSGEGFKIVFRGNGTLYISTRQLPAIAGKIAPYIPRSN